MANKKIKVILLEDVPKTGYKYEVEEVAMGYFRNYLLPNGMAEPATDEVLKKLEKERKEANKKREQRMKKNKEQAEEIKGMTVKFRENAGDDDQLYGSVTSSDIERRLKEKGFADASAKLSEPIKELGGQEVTVDFGEGITSYINVDVLPSGKNE